MNKTHLENLFKQHQSEAPGLNETEIQKRQTFYGPNQLKSKKRTPAWLQFLEEFKDLMVIILIVATILAFLTGETIDALIILFIIILNATIGFIQKFKAEKALEALQKLIAPQAKVLRGGHIKNIAAIKIVPGDILILDEGDHISADAVLFDSSDIQTQEAILTGESLPVSKDDFSHIFMGTMVVHGRAKAIVIKTGMETEMGKIAKLTSETKQDPTPLQKELRRINIFIGQITLILAVILFLLGIFVQHRSLIDTLLFATAVAVAAVPEGLPATITITLALGVQRLAKNKAIVKQLASVETLGGTTVICTDKTGTLTKNEMTVTELYFDRYHAKISGVGYEPKGSIQLEKAGSTTASPENTSTILSKHPDIAETFKLLLLTAGLCNNATIRYEHEQWQVIGDPTEGALMSMVRKSEIGFEQLQNEYEKLHEYAFDSARKCMTVVMRHKSSNKIFVFTKGAPSNILEHCDHVMMNGHAIRLDKETHQNFLEKNDQLADLALRGLAFAYRELTPHEIKSWEKSLETLETSATPKKSAFDQQTIEANLIFLGLTGMIDPPRAEIKSAIELTYKAGIRVYIITGDHGLTAQAIAKDTGLITKESKVIILTGHQLNEMSDTEVKNFLSNHELHIIFARVNPEHKLRIVSLLKELGEIVAVTGDGVNDAPALKRADIGIAMGSGTDVSKEAANMILTDNSFATIITAIKEGRTIYENLKKFIFFMFSTNIGELLTIFIAILLNLPPPLIALMVLFVNLFTDILPALALGVEPTETTIMSHKPRHPEQKMLSGDFLNRIGYISFFIGVIVIGAFMWELGSYGWTWGSAIATDSEAYIKASTIAFVLLVMIQMAHVFNAKSENESIFKKTFFNNFKLIGAAIISIILMVMIVEIPIFQKFIHTTALDITEWGFVIIGSLIIIAIEEIRKFISRQQKTNARFF